MKYEPYTGGAGPGEEQIAQNNYALCMALIKQGIPAILVQDPNPEGAPAEPEELPLVVKVEDVHIAYDRWGFCTIEVSDLDQAQWDTTLQWAKNLYFKVRE